MNKLCVHSITTKPWNLKESVQKYQQVGVKGISVWQDAAEAIGINQAGQLLADAELEVVSYVRGGFFAHTSESERQKAIDHNKQLIDEAAILGAPLLVLVCGADPQQRLSVSRDQIQYGIEALLDHATSAGVKLGIEPLHPVYADTRSAISSLAQANAMAERIDHEMVGVVIDVYHVWWEDQLEAEIKRCGQQGNIFGFHTCDWNVPTLDVLNDRGLMGEGCIPTKQIRQWVEDAGFNGYIEVEIFSHKHWAEDQDDYLARIIQSYKTCA